MAASNARVSLVPASTSRQDRLAAATPSHLLFIGDNTLQMKMLVSMLSGKFSMPANIMAFSKLSAEDLDESPDALVILDCQTLHPNELLSLMEAVDPERPPGVVLINTRRDTPLKQLAEWPHVTGIFQDSLEPDMLLNGFEQVLQGGLWLPRGVMENLLQHGRRKATSKRSRPLPVKLTRRETQVLEKLAEGTSNTRIADSLFLSEHTVKTHLYNIYKKVNVRNRTQACNWLKRYRGD